MTQQIINLGATGSGAGGDSARTAFEKAIANFAELYIAALPGTAEQKQTARDMFGLGTAATKAAQGHSTDLTPGALMAVGAFGWNGGMTQGLSDANTVKTPGAYSIYQTANAPYAFGNLISFAWGADPSWATEIAMQVTGSGLAYRSAQDGVGGFGSWNSLFHTGNILGPVSQAGGIPTGAIIERGSNANGVYWRFAGGLQVCITVDKLRPEAGGRMTFEWPAGFAATPTTSTTVVPSFAWETPTGQYGSVETGLVYFAGAGGANRIYMQAVGYWHN